MATDPVVENGLGTTTNEHLRDQIDLELVALLTSYKTKRDELTRCLHECKSTLTRLAVLERESIRYKDASKTYHDEAKVLRDQILAIKNNLPK